MLHSVKDKYSSSQSPAGLGMPALGVILRERQGYRSVVLNEARPAIKSQGGKLKKIEKKDLEDFGHNAIKVP